jgi:hypothetical protein
MRTRGARRLAFTLYSSLPSCASLGTAVARGVPPYGSLRMIFARKDSPQFVPKDRRGPA